MWLNLLANGECPGLLGKMLNHPLKLGVWGTGSGVLATVFSKVAENVPEISAYDKFVYRLGATAAALASVLTVILLIYRILKARKDALESNKSDEHD